MKKLLAILLSLTMLLVMVAACGGDDDNGSGSSPAADSPTPGNSGGGGGGDDYLDNLPGGNITLRLWGGEAEGNQEFLRERADAFIELHKDRANITIDIGIVGEGTARDTVLTDPQAAADVFTIADDQVLSLYNAGALQEITLNADKIKSENVAASLDLATIDGKLYAYPMTADNGYLMFYDKSYFTEDDVKSLDRMMEVAAAAGKQVTSHMANGWWGIAFMRAKGLDTWVNADGSAGCNFNGPGGTDVLQAMLDIVANPGYIALPDGDFLTVIGDGSVIAGINGIWNANSIQATWGDNYGAAKLPTITIAGEQVQMGGVLGSKLMGVNAYSANVGWAMVLAEYLTDYESQVLRYERTGQGPSNIRAGSSAAVQENIALAALAEQGQFSMPMVAGDNYWGPSETLFQIIVNGNPDGTDLQKLLDDAVEAILS